LMPTARFKRRTSASGRRRAGAHFFLERSRTYSAGDKGASGRSVAPGLARGLSQTRLCAKPHTMASSDKQTWCQWCPNAAWQCRSTCATSGMYRWRFIWKSSTAPMNGSCARFLVSWSVFTALLGCNASFNVYVRCLPTANRNLRNASARH